MPNAVANRRDEAHNLKSSAGSRRRHVDVAYFTREQARIIEASQCNKIVAVILRLETDGAPTCFPSSDMVAL